MHALPSPPLLHRDLKVENVLISGSGSSTTYKLCDFGSTAPPRPAASSAAEGRIIEDDIQRHTTLQYRSPEMIDVYRKQPIDEKSDVWALGVFLYKLCYYTTPFEEVGQMAILNASFNFPAHPAFSDQLKMLIATMLRENPAKRLNIYQVLQQTCLMQGKEVPIRDIYTSRSQSEKRKSRQLPASSEEPTAATGAMLSPPSQSKPAALPDIAPMRRGRPTKAVSHRGSAQPSPSPLRMIDQPDPFASLDGGKQNAADELSARFPTLDQFSLLTERGQTFDFETSVAGRQEISKPDLSQRVVNALADEAFARPPSPEKPRPTKTAPPVTNPSSRVLLDGKKSYEAINKVPPEKIVSPSPHRPSMVSTGTMTSPSPPPPSSDRPVTRIGLANHGRRPSSLPRSSETSRPMSAVASSGSRLSSLLSHDAARSQQAALAEPILPSSSRPSLEGARPSVMEFDSSLSRSKSTNPKMRPASMNIVSQMGFYRRQKSTTPSNGTTDRPVEQDLPPLPAVGSDTNITSDVEFLRAKEEEEKAWKGHKRHSSGSSQRKRGSLPSISLSGTKNLLAGRFGDAFRKFENGNNTTNSRSRSPSPSQDPVNVLTPIAGSEATDLSEERHALDETEDLSPEMRRELERQRLSAEEKRVANAAAEYRKRLVEKSGERGRDHTRAVSIQNKVQSLLKENERRATKTAAGYGRFTNSDASPQMKQFEPSQNMVNKSSPRIPPIPNLATSSPTFVEGSFSKPPSTITSPLSIPSNALPNPLSLRTVSRPAAPPKPKNMRIGMGEAVVSPLGSSHEGFNSVRSPADDWEATFSKRYPSLSGLEMVETEIDTPKVAAARMKEV